MSLKEANTPVTLNVHTDPLCPLAWRTALWLREARKERPITIEWKIFSLEIINRPEGAPADYVNGMGWIALRTLVLARRQQGNAGFEKLYIALGNSQHGEKKGIGKQEVVEASAVAAGFGAELVQQALEDESTIQDVLSDHQEARERYHAFGVPTLAFPDSRVGYYGPIIHSVPTGNDASELWDYTAWALKNDNIFELKRDRNQAEWGPVSAQ